MSTLKVAIIVGDQLQYTKTFTVYFESNCKRYIGEEEPSVT